MKMFFLIALFVSAPFTLAFGADQVPRPPRPVNDPKIRKPLPPPSDREVREFLVRESLLHYVGYCPCPYHLRNDGKKCGKESGYDRTGGALPICYPTDVTDEQVGEFRLKLQRNQALKPGT